MLEAQVNESEHFFQTDETKRLIERRMAKAKETENRGDPFKCSSKVLSLDLLPQQSTDNGKLLAVVGESGFIAKKIDLTDKKVLQVFRGHNGPVSAVFAHGGFLVTGSWDKKIKKWDMETGKELLSLDDAHKDFVKTLVVRAYPSGKTVIYSGSADSSVRMWDFETGTALGRLEGHRRGVEAMVLDYAGEILFTASSDKSIRKFNVHTGECLAVFDGHETNIYSLFLNEDDEELWSGMRAYYSFLMN
jgi:WD40 repeat protein